MIVDNTLNNRQPQPGAAGAAGTVAAYKRLKQVLPLLRFNPRSIIFYGTRARLASLPLLTLIQPLP